MGAVEHHDHPGAGTYLRIGLVLFVLTALEVGAYELSHRGGAAQMVLKPVIVPVLLALSAFKFALVGMYYMHLKQDSRLFTLLFVFSLMLAAIIVLLLIILMSYHVHYNTGIVA